MCNNGAAVLVIMLTKNVLLDGGKKPSHKISEAVSHLDRQEFVEGGKKKSNLFIP